MPPRPERHGSAEAAVADIPDGASILVAGFHAGVPWNLMRALHGQGAADLVMISTTVNRPLLDVDGRVTIADLAAAGRVRRVVASFTAAPHPSQPNDAERVFREGGAEAELVPQGTLAERIRAGGAGIPAFYAPAGLGSAWAAGRETRAFDGREYLLERAIAADYAFVRARRADEAGNLVFRLAARNFNPIMAAAARCTIAEVDEPILPAGAIDPDAVHTPGVHVARLVHVAEGRVGSPRRTRRSGRETDLGAEPAAGGGP